MGGLIILGAMVKTGKPVGAFLKSSVQGILVLLAVNLTGSLTGITLSVNALSMGITCLAGAPGVVALLMFNLFAG